MNKLPVYLLVVYAVIITTAHAGWTYLVPNYDWFGYRDRSGVLHAWQADEARYDPVTREYQVLIGRHWLRVGTDVDRLSD